MRPLSIVLLTATVLVPVLRADEVRLADGRVLVGPARTAGGFVRVETLDGTVVVPLRDVVRHRTADALRAELQALAERVDGSAFARLQLARTARRWGLYDEMWQHLDAALAATRPGSADRARLRAFLGDLEKEVLPRKWRDQPTAVRVRELLYRIRPGTEPSRAAAVEALLAREPDADPELRHRARGSTRNARRLTALRALGRRRAEGNDRFVYRTMIVDGNFEVRDGTATAVRATGRSADAVHYLAPGLMHEAPLVRIRTAEAFGHLGGDAAVDALVAAGPYAGKRLQDAGAGATRGNVAFIDQTSYIRDFDVEVAQASFIADPKVDILQSGTVLDATVHAVITYRTEIVRAYRNALRRIANSDPGPDPEKWAAWREQLRRSAEPPQTGE